MLTKQYQLEDDFISIFNYDALLRKNIDIERISNKFLDQFPFDRAPWQNTLQSQSTLFDSPDPIVGLLKKTFILSILSISPEKCLGNNVKISGITGFVLKYSPESHGTKFHIHCQNGNTNGYVCIYYIKIPNELSGDEGAIAFKTKTDKLTIYPEHGSLIVFPRKLSHCPIPFPNGKGERLIVTADVIL